jgi:hypothetical protein
MAHNPFDNRTTTGSVGVKEPRRRNLVGCSTVNSPTPSDLIAISHNFTAEHELRVYP